MEEPPQLASRPVSPENNIIRPIPIKPNPSQIITLSDVANLENKQEPVDNSNGKSGLLSLIGSLGVIPKQLKEKPQSRVWKSKAESRGHMQRQGSPARLKWKITI